MSKLMIIVVLLISNMGFAQEMIEVVSEQTSTSKNSSKARQEMFQQAVEKVSMDYIKEFVGERKLSKFQNIIQRSIIPESGKYILYQKGDGLERTSTGHSMSVIMKVSLKNLKALLLEKGLMYQMEGQPKVLPLVAYIDKVESLRQIWWAETSGEGSTFAVEQTKLLHNSLQEEFSGLGFYTYRPMQWGVINLLPEVLRVERPRTEDLTLIGEYMDADIVIRGQLEIDNKKGLDDIFIITMKFVALQAENGRIVGEVARSFETEPGSHHLVVQKKLIEVIPQVNKDLGEQIRIAWQKGTFGAELVQLKISGNISFEKYKDLKQKLSNLKQVKSLKERLFEPNSVEFEVDVSVGTKSFYETLKKEASGLNLNIDELDGQKISMRLKN
ncbi:MAG: hypothetical protein MK008_09195 [Bdellovibrionales bacterium]|nr:hypothetical protein [Bdellovibrionales bacterium]